MDPEDLYTYELHFPDRVGSNKVIGGQRVGVGEHQHKWYYYPDMSSDEVLMFSVFDRKYKDEQGNYYAPRYALHT